MIIKSNQMDKHTQKQRIFNLDWNIQSGALKLKCILNQNHSVILRPVEEPLPAEREVKSDSVLSHVLTLVLFMEFFS